MAAAEALRARGWRGRAWAALAALALVGAAPEPLAQGWSVTEREIFRNSPVGSRVVPYDVFVRLEAEGGASFAAPAHMQSFGYVVAGANPTNPDGLPVGFARERDREGRLWLGMSCAACHTGSIGFQGRTVLVDGGAGLVDTQRFDRELTAALEATVADEERLGRLAGRLGLGAEGLAGLRDRVSEAASARRAWTEAGASSHPAGPGRLDWAGLAAGAAGLRHVTGGKLDAPVRIPVLWGSAAYVVAMRDGSVVNVGAGPLLRDAAQVLASYGPAGDVSVPDLLKIEALLGRLQPPPWPDAFPPVDQERAGRGAGVFRQNCAGCHGAQPAAMVAASQVGTEVAAAGAGWRAVIAVVEPVLPERMQGAVARWRAAMAAQMRGTDALRATPLAGVWASAPYLHNGSVASLAELLRPAAERARRFSLGGRDYDPGLVGYGVEVAGGGFVLDTAVPGNAAVGHEYGTGLGEGAKRDLIEYLKGL